MRSHANGLLKFTHLSFLPRTLVHLPIQRQKCLPKATDGFLRCVTYMSRFSTAGPDTVSVQLLEWLGSLREKKTMTVKLARHGTALSVPLPPFIWATTHPSGWEDTHSVSGSARSRRAVVMPRKCLFLNTFALLRTSSTMLISAWVKILAGPLVS